MVEPKMHDVRSSRVPKSPDNEIMGPRTVGHEWDRAGSREGVGARLPCLRDPFALESRILVSCRTSFIATATELAALERMRASASDKIGIVHISYNHRAEVPQSAE
jgi:hypothetical protein